MREQMHDQLEQCEPVRPKRPVFVDVYAHEDKSGEIRFSHDWRLQENGPVKGKGAIEVPQGTPPSPIHFHLRDESGRKLKFFQDAEEALWASVGKCPDAKGGGGQIEYPDARSGGNTLKVDNVNSEACELHYALRFKDRDGNVVIYDPVIRNKGSV
jgi:hypothetical protein